MTGLRSKINDRFEFPHEIDMAPYHVDYLQNPEQTCAADMFELVGVLVHSGTAESGHYYSYIRERPVNPSSSKQWVEFNDADVSPFDPAQLADQCFGGLTEASPYTFYPKQWNAYMLFYQRKNAIASDISTYCPPTSGLPVRIEVPTGLFDRIALDNAFFTRKFCLLDESYALFATALLEQLGHFKKGICSAEHLVERDAIWLSLNTLDKIFCRVKDCSGFDKMLGTLMRVMRKCTNCCKIALDWVASSEHNIRPMLLRCPVPKVRKDFSTLIFNGLRHLHHNDSLAYGLNFDDGTGEASSDQYERGAFPNIVRRLGELREKLPLHARGWDDYFGLIADMASSGSTEVYVLIQEGFLRHCLEILIVEQPEARQPLSRDNNSLAKYLQLIKKGRKYSLHKLIELLSLLLEQVNLTEEPVEANDFEDRPVIDGKVLLNVMEDEYLRFGSVTQRPRNLVFLEKILGSQHNCPAVERIIEIVLLTEPGANLLLAVQKTILSGINVDPAELAAPYLRAAIVFCRFCPSQAPIKEVIKHIAGEVDTIGIHGGQEHLEFFSSARLLCNMRAPKNQSSFQRLVLQTVPFWAPALIMYWEESIRQRTIELLRILVFNFDIQNMDDEREADEIQRIGRELCEKCVKRVEECITEPQKTVEIKTVESVIMVIKHCVHHYIGVNGIYRPISVHAESPLPEHT